MKTILIIRHYVILCMFFAIMTNCNNIFAQTETPTNKTQAKSKNDCSQWERFIQKGRIGFLDFNGEVVIPAKYEEAYFFQEELAAVKLNDKWGFIDKTGKEITQLKYDRVSTFNGGMADVQLNGKCGFIDKTGKEIVLLKYKHASGFYRGLSAVILDGGGLGFIDKKGEEIIK